MTAQTDLAKMLDGLTVTRRPGTFVVISTPDPVALGNGVEAILAEGEGVTVVATKETAQRNRWTYDFESAWLTLDVHSSLAAVGLTAHVSTVLAAQSIACNMLAGYFHDHLLVPADRVDDAIACIEAHRD